jgi:hypothetical protein
MVFTRQPKNRLSNPKLPDTFQLNRVITPLYWVALGNCLTGRVRPALLGQGALVTVPLSSKK